MTDTGWENGDILYAKFSKKGRLILSKTKLDKRKCDSEMRTVTYSKGPLTKTIVNNGEANGK